MDDAEKLELISRIVRLQAGAQDGGDQHQADAYLAMEAIEIILTGDRNLFTAGAVRTYLPGEMP
jgi:hypothetical protein